ncbi:NADPH oxidase activator 1 isoform X2 [Pseudophryne corroboree]|uniref:NADPH oxidase activator 1 isoform X2 n=1 Tax=Pseudophryne corroboree TaxID=495146 RepID=UPI003081AA97
MPYKDLVKCWNEGVLAADQKDLDSALQHFTCIDDPPSKIWFNIGCIHILKGDLENALQAYSQCVAKDNCLAVGFFQRSYVHFKLERYEKALTDCHLALAQLRDNSVIDYKQLGLRHLLYSWEVVYNTAVILSYLGKWEKAQEKLNEAFRCLPGETGSLRLDVALTQIQRQVLLQPMGVPEGELFRPRKQEVDQLKFKDFLGKPKIISSVVPNDQYSGFEPLRPQKPGFYEPCREAMQGREAGYHRVLVHYYPENSAEVAVKASSILYVLNKDESWATAIHDGQKILIPTNFLEPVNAPKADMKKMNNGIPLPPTKMPPTRPNVKPTSEQWPQQGNLIPAQDVPPRPTGDLPEPTEPVRGKMDIRVRQDQELETAVHRRRGQDLEVPVPSRDEGVGDMAVPTNTVDVTIPFRSHLIENVISPPIAEPVRVKEAPQRPQPKVETVVTLQSAQRPRQEAAKEEMTQTLMINSHPADSAASSADDRHVAQNKPDHAVEAGVEDSITLQVHTEFTVDLSVRKDITYLQLQHLLRQKLEQQGVQMDIHLSYRDVEGKHVTPVKEDRDLQGMWGQARNKRLMLCCKDAYHCVGRPILYRMRAIYTYPSEGPEDLTFNQGDTIDILSEVNEDWLEGHCNGSIGIFPKCFVTFIDERDPPGT